MHSRWIWTFVICAAIVLALGIVIPACGDDDDDDNDDKSNDFEELEGTAYDPEEYADGYDTGDENAGQGCNCPGCEGCGDVVTMFDAFAVAEDFEALVTDFGADELGYYLDLDSVNISDDELGCFVDMTADTVECVDNGLNCLAGGGETACAEDADLCLGRAQDEFFECLDAGDSACWEYVDCVMGCSKEIGQDCYEGCMNDFEACEVVFAPMSRIQCLEDLSGDFAFIGDVSDVFTLAADYAACAG